MLFFRCLNLQHRLIQPHIFLIRQKRSTNLPTSRWTYLYTAYLRRKDNNGYCFTWEPAAGEQDGGQRRALRGGSADGGSSPASPRCWVELDFGKSVPVKGLTIEPLAIQPSGENIGYMYGIVGGAEIETRERKRESRFYSKTYSHDGRRVRRWIRIALAHSPWYWLHGRAVAACWQDSLGHMSNARTLSTSIGPRIANPL